MKKSVFALFALLALTVASCGSEPTEKSAIDSAAVATDSSACCKDTAANVIPVDTNRESAEPQIDRPE